jgi:hypothetical protein
MYLREFSTLRSLCFAVLVLVCLPVAPGCLNASTLPPSLDNSLSFYMSLDEGSGTTAADAAKGDTGLLMNFGSSPNSGWVSGIQGGALSFNGVNNYVGLSGRALNLTNTFTVSAWLYPRNTSGNGAFFSVRSNYQTSGLRLFIQGNALVVQGQTSTGWKSVTLAAGAFQNTAWYHVVVAYNKSTIEAFVNGVSQGTASVNGGFVMNAAYPTKIGVEGAYFFNGSIDEVMVFDRSLTADEIVTVYQNALPADRPNAPSNLTAAATSSSQIDLSWQHDGNNTAAFLVKRSTSLAGPWLIIATVPSSVRTYSDTGLPSSTTFFYKVRAENQDPSLKSLKSNEASATTLSDAPNPPGNLAAQALSPTQISLTWYDSSNNELGFIVERATSLSGPWTQIATVGANVRSYTDTTVSPSSLYYYRIGAFN